MSEYVFALYDVKAEYYRKPFIMKSRGEALRAFEDLANDKETEIGKHPSDFCLFLIAEFDEREGKYINQKCPVSLGLAIEFVKGQYKPIELEEKKNEN